MSTISAAAASTSSYGSSDPALKPLLGGVSNSIGTSNSSRRSSQNSSSHNHQTSTDTPDGANRSLSPPSRKQVNRRKLSVLRSFLRVTQQPAAGATLLPSLGPEETTTNAGEDGIGYGEEEEEDETTDVYHPRRRFSPTATENQVELAHTPGTIWNAVRTADVEEMDRVLAKEGESVLWKRDTIHATPLHMCFVYNSPAHSRMAEQIMNAYPELVCDQYGGTEYTGENILHIAIVNRQESVVAALIARNRRLLTQRAIGNFFQQGQPCYYGELPLFFAACTNQPKLVKMLLEGGADINEEDGNGNSILHLCIIHSLPGMYAYLKKEWKERYETNAVGLPPSSRPPELWKRTNLERHTPLTLAAKLGLADMFAFLLEEDKRVQWIYGPVSMVLLPLDGVDLPLYTDGSAPSVIYSTEAPEAILAAPVNTAPPLQRTSSHAFAPTLGRPPSIAPGSIGAIAIAAEKAAGAPSITRTPSRLPAHERIISGLAPTANGLLSVASIASNPSPGASPGSSPMNSNSPSTSPRRLSRVDGNTAEPTGDSLTVPGALSTSSSTSINSTSSSGVVPSISRPSSLARLVSSSRQRDRSPRTLSSRSLIQRNDPSLSPPPHSVPIVEKVHRPPSVLGRGDGALELIVQHAHLDLLMHPRVLELIEKKWDKFACRIFWRRCLVSFLYLAIFTIGTIWRTTAHDKGTHLLTRDHTVKHGSSLMDTSGVSADSLRSASLLPNPLEYDPIGMFEDFDLFLYDIFFGHHLTWSDIFSAHATVQYIGELIVVIGALAKGWWEIREMKKFGLASYRNATGSALLENILSLTFCICIFLVLILTAMNSPMERAVMAIASITAWCYCFFFLLAFRLTGPMVVMIYRMLTSDVLRFVMIYCIFLMGFSLSFFVLFDHDGFHGFNDSFASCFLTTLGDFDVGDYTDLQYWGLSIFLLVCFIIVVTILLLNMLIAMMADTYSHINAKADKQWHLERARIIFAIEHDMSQSDRELPEHRYWVTVEGKRYLQVKVVDPKHFEKLGKQKEFYEKKCGTPADGDNDHDHEHEKGADEKKVD